MDITDKGFIYAIQLMPDVRPNRIKIGFAEDPEERLKNFQTPCPQAVILKTWPTHRWNESDVLKHINKVRRKRFSREVFEFHSLDSFFHSMEKFWEECA